MTKMTNTYIKIAVAICASVLVSSCSNTNKTSKTAVKDTKTVIASPVNKNPTAQNKAQVQNAESQEVASLKKAPVINNQTKFSSKEYGVAGSPRVQNSKIVRKGGGRYQVGKPYTVRGRKYYPREDPNYKAVGLASWYGPNFHGRLTANGEVYDQYALSAAHPTLPLPSYVRVTNMENKSSVIVRVNDRGPFSKNRVIDLSARAAELLGYTHKGLAKVKVEYAGKAALDGLDEKRLVASYNPGRLDVNKIPPNGRGDVVLAQAKPAQKPSIVAQSFIETEKPVTATSNAIALPAKTIAPVPRPKTLVNSFTNETSATARLNNAMVWYQASN